ncbi:MAG: Cardiolipin synthase [Chlamydiales bacterium]|nr:Cardiolipin synthase [Chlamydiales bacterium]
MLNRLIKPARILFTLLILLLFFYLEERPTLSSNEPVQLYASACHDDLCKVVLNAIQGASESIYLVMYSLNENKVIKALNQKAKEGVEVTVVYDPTTPQEGYEKLVGIKRLPIKISGLMHKKILIVDQERILVGSANFTRGSLRSHDNLVVGATSAELSRVIQNEEPEKQFIVGGQRLEFWSLPRDKKEGLTRLIGLIEGAQKTIQVAMYTWTHPVLTEAIVQAHQRGVHVEVILDRGQANGVGRKALQSLVNSGVPIWLSTGRKLLHHKCLVVDNAVLVNGSANWTRAAFSRNHDCFFVLQDLSEAQQEKLATLWKRTRILSTRKTPSKIVQLPRPLHRQAA